MWKKRAIYGFYIVVIFGLLINLYIGVGLIGSLSGLMGGIILFLVTKKKMQYFV
jgi:membrane associated rhomboid family serine protease